MGAQKDKIQKVTDWMVDGDPIDMSVVLPGNVQLIGGQRDTALDEIFERITQDVFNASLAKW